MMDANVVPADGGSAMMTQLTASAMIVWLLQRLKAARSLPWISAETEKLNRIVAVLLSGAAAVGVHLTFDKTAGVLTISGLTVTGVALGLWHWMQSYAVQETMYRATVYRSPNANGNGTTNGSGNGSGAAKVAAAGTVAVWLLAVGIALALAPRAQAQTVIAPATVKPQNIVFRAGGGEGFDGRLAPYFFIHTGTGAPAGTDCDAAGEVGRFYLRSDAAAASSSLYVCANTAPATYAWELIGVGTVTHTAGTLDANQIVIGNGGADVKKLGSLGTTTTVVHGNAAGAPSYGAVVEADQSLSDLTTNDCSTSKHGYTPKAPNDTSKFLRGDCSWAASTSTPTDIQFFTSNGTWTKPAGAKVTRVIIIGAGGGGGSGRRGLAGALRVGGGGGGGGAATVLAISSSLLGATETVTVGTGGTGGTAISVDTTNGNNGVAGGASSFGNWGRATGGGFGGGGTATIGTAGLGAIVGSAGCGGDGQAGGNSSAGFNSGRCSSIYTFSAGTGDSSFTLSLEGQSLGGGGGGPGGYISAANAITAGGAGGQGSLVHNSTLTGGTSGGTTVVGGAGTSATANEGIGGAGGGGGSANGAANNTGGAGGIYGGGGGGGGASLNGTASGAGGAGANGIVIVITEF